jgi:carbonic anhydrase/acetyltransferase-like protein (isoleucine patch superfamily)
LQEESQAWIEYDIAKNDGQLTQYFNQPVEIKEDVTIEDNCHVHGEVQYTRELRVSQNASLAKAPMKVDTLPG